ncbi:MAG: homocysteine S-methyltransferase family protein [Myxococcales bacterium FL481]|nr:MAG: homocysteine S-methyltransferase family protein [Myxococcales bacterium FL481]
MPSGAWPPCVSVWVKASHVLSNDPDALQLASVSHSPLLLDGALGTELERRGARMDAPLWSAHALIDAPEIVADVHAEYLRAGADVVTTNTFRTHARNLAADGRAGEAEELTRRAVAMAIGARVQVAATHPRAKAARVAGAISPLEDCFRPDESPQNMAAFNEHATMARTLVEAGVDLLLIETMSRVDEAIAAVSAASGFGVPVWLAVVGRDDGRLLGGETFAALVDSLAAHELNVDALLINCTELGIVDRLLSTLRACLPAEGAPAIGTYPHTGRNDPDVGFQTHATTPIDFARQVSDLAQTHGLDIVGSCCGSTPVWTAQLRECLDHGRSAQPDTAS